MRPAHIKMTTRVDLSRIKAEEESSSMENCSFVCHIMTLPLGLLNLLWVVLDDASLEKLNITYYPPREWATYMPISALTLFLAAPALYAAFNMTTVPRLDSPDTLTDIHARQPSSGKGARTPAHTLPPESPLPEICDLDAASLVWYSQS